MFLYIVLFQCTVLSMVQIELLTLLSALFEYYNTLKHHLKSVSIKLKKILPHINPYLKKYPRKVILSVVLS